MQFHLTDGEILHAPKSLVSIIELNIFQCEATHLAEELGRINHAVTHHHIITVPDG